MTSYLNPNLQKIIEEYCVCNKKLFDELKEKTDPILRKLCFCPFVDFQYKFIKECDDTYYRFYYYCAENIWVIQNRDISHIEFYKRDHLVFEKELRDNSLGLGDSAFSKTYIKW